MQGSVKLLIKQISTDTFFLHSTAWLIKVTRNRSILALAQMMVSQRRHFHSMPKVRLVASHPFSHLVRPQRKMAVRSLVDLSSKPLALKPLQNRWQQTPLHTDSILGRWLQMQIVPQAPIHLHSSLVIWPAKVKYSQRVLKRLVLGQANRNQIHKRPNQSTLPRKTQRVTRP